jgi:hypothetical protein
MMTTTTIIIITDDCVTVVGGCVMVMIYRLLPFNVRSHHTAHLWSTLYHIVVQIILYVCK